VVTNVAQTPGSPNQEQIQRWNEIMAPRFARFRRVLAEGLGAHSEAALRRWPPSESHRVLDVGCGFGETSLHLARLVGTDGVVVGIDVCEPFLDVARAEAGAAGVAHVRYALADAQTAQLPPEFDLCFARFGTMFFDTPIEAMRNLHGAVKPGGRLMMLVWRRLEDNPWAAIPRQIARKHLPPAPGAPSGGPGPFSMADEDGVRAILDAAGWTAVELERLDATMPLGDTIDDAVAFQVTLGPAGQIIREAGDLGRERRPLIEAELREALAPLASAQGLRLASSSWCVMARARAA
jgi:ubiquinone/menaquinone biosynthesis C-methylase UbiE